MKKLILAALCVPAFAFANSGDGPSNSTTPQGVGLVCSDFSGKVQQNLRVNFPAVIFDSDAPLSAANFDANALAKQIQVISSDASTKYSASIRVGKTYGADQGEFAGKPATYTVEIWSDGQDSMLLTLNDFLTVAGGADGNVIMAMLEIQKPGSMEPTSILNTVTGMYAVTPDNNSSKHAFALPVLCQLIQ